MIDEQYHFYAGMDQLKGHGNRERNSHKKHWDGDYLAVNLLNAGCDLRQLRNV
jgi:hypothetical protein